MLQVIGLLTLAVTTCLGATEGLSKEERDQFYNSNEYGGMVSLTEHDSYYVVESNGLPDHDTQQKNKNAAEAQNFRFTFNKEIDFACTPGSLPKGPIAITKTGVAIYNPLSSTDENAVDGDGAERFDRCHGHSDRKGIYHYHQSPGADNCGVTFTAEPDQFIGVALDGFPIYGPYASDKGGEALTSADLDVCHGRMLDGKYRYHLTSDFPYVLGCYWGAGAKDNSPRVSYTCDPEVGTDLPDLGYLCSNVEQRNVDAVVCNEYPGTAEVTTNEDEMEARNMVTSPPMAAPTKHTKRPHPKTGELKLREYTPSPLRGKNGGLRLREYTPSPLREKKGGLRLREYTPSPLREKKGGLILREYTPRPLREKNGGPKLREYTPSPLREKNGGPKLREYTPSPLREAYLKRWLKDLLERST
ncbi:uncharacterized protein LOC125666006 isoform X2 [Ostrea edulis]|nr:uncharacterized protein LOC125666006 isoform X2 [Ostrea edulis]XP_048755035.2 uncharacterized protein LOC125666006 isoform X2 [Ostrea edulis]